MGGDVGDFVGFGVLVGANEVDGWCEGCDEIADGCDDGAWEG